MPVPDLARNYSSVIQPIEVNSIPEELKYIKNFSMINNIVKPFSIRGAWLATIGLCLWAIVPLLGKLFLNVIDGFVHPSSFKEAGKNALAILAIPFICFISGVSFIFPSFIGGRLARGIVLPIVLEQSSHKTHELIHDFPGEWAQKVKGLDGIIIDSADFPCPTSNGIVQRYRIVFNAAGEMYQQFPNTLVNESIEFGCNTRTFNYPGITENNPPGSSLDFINAGVAEVYDVVKKMNWTNVDLEKKLHLLGYCFGGGIALSVAAYFKELHGVDLSVFIDRSYTSYSDAMAGVMHRYSGVPFVLAKAIAKTFLYAGGGLDVDSIAAIKKLDPQHIYHINVGASLPSPKTKVALVKRAFGIGAISDPDTILLNKVTLTEGLKRAQIECGGCTKDILNELKIESKEPHLVYSATNQGHFENRKDLKIGEKPFVCSASDYYQTFIDITSRETEISTHNQSFQTRKS